MSEIYSLPDPVTIRRTAEEVIQRPDYRVDPVGQSGKTMLDFVLELLGWILNPADRGLTVHRLCQQVIKRFREEGIEIPFPQRDVHLPERAASTGTLRDFDADSTAD